MSQDQGQSHKLALVEARVELDDMRKDLVAANADRAAARLEAKCDRELATLAAKRNEALSRDLRNEVEAVRTSLQTEISNAEDAAHAAMEKSRMREAELYDELAKTRGATEAAAASMLQRVFNKRWTRVLKERCNTAQAQVDLANAEHHLLNDELESAQRALQSSTARSLQRALKRKMKGAMLAAAGNAEALQAMHEDRQLADVRQLEKEQADLRTALNESRRRAARLDKRVQQAEGGSMVVAGALPSAVNPPAHNAGPRPTSAPPPAPLCEHFSTALRRS